MWLNLYVNMYVCIFACKYFQCSLIPSTPAIFAAVKKNGMATKLSLVHVHVCVCVCVCVYIHECMCTFVQVCIPVLADVIA